MNTRERFIRTLTGQPVDRVPFMKIFGGTNAVNLQWEQEMPGISQNIDHLLGFEGEYRGWQITRVNMGMCGVTVIDRQAEGEKIIERKSDGTVTLIHRGKDRGFSHILQWPVRGWEDWKRVRERHLQAEDPSRFPENWKQQAAGYMDRDYPLQLTHGGVYGFARNLMGDEQLAYAFFDEPELVHEMMDSYMDMCLAVWERMTGDAAFDLIECWEDMAFNGGSLISPAIFREFLLPNYLKISRFAKEHEIPIVLVDSDGFIEELVPLMLEGGVNCLYPFEVQAGNDVLKVRERYPDLGAVGCLDKNSMDGGEEAIDREMMRARALIRRGRIIPGPDHFPIKSSFKNYRYFMERLKEVVMEETDING